MQFRYLRSIYDLEIKIDFVAEFFIGFAKRVEETESSCLDPLNGVPNYELWSYVHVIVTV